jgi:hypothetical protein
LSGQDMPHYTGTSSVQQLTVMGNIQARLAFFGRDRKTCARDIDRQTAGRIGLSR